MSFSILQRTSSLRALGVLAVAAIVASACTGRCEGEARCLGGECVSFAHEGDSCIPGSCAAGLWCPPPSFVCTRLSQPGPACTGDPQKAACGDGHCDPVTFRCQPLPALGDECSIDGRCGIDGVCVDGKCSPLPGEYEQCLDTADGKKCAIDLACSYHLCVRPADNSCPLVP